MTTVQTANNHAFKLFNLSECLIGVYLFHVFVICLLVLQIYKNLGGSPREAS